jgi:hypothetical protein
MEEGSPAIGETRVPSQVEYEYFTYTWKDDYTRQTRLLHIGGLVWADRILRFEKSFTVLDAEDFI